MGITIEGTFAIYIKCFLFYLWYNLLILSRKPCVTVLGEELRTSSDRDVVLKTSAVATHPL